MATITWAAGTNGDWGTDASWTSGTVPGPSDDAQIVWAPAGTAPYTVTIGALESAVADSVMLAQAQAGLDVAGVLAVKEQLSVESPIGMRLGGEDPGTVIANSVINDGDISGTGTLVAGTLVNAHVIGAVTGQTLAILAGSFTNVTADSIGGLDAFGGTTLLKSPAFGNPLTNLQDGTLTGGIYEAAFGGTLVLPEDSIITNDAAFFELNQSGASIQFPDSESGALHQLESTLNTIDPSGELSIESGYSYYTSNMITDAGILRVIDGSIAAASLAVAAGGTLIGWGTVAAGTDNAGKIIAAPEGLGFLPQQTIKILTIEGPVIGSGSMEIQNGAMLQLTAPTTADVTFSGGGGGTELAAGLELGTQANRADGPIGYTGTISGFHGSATDNGAMQPGDTVYLPGLDPDAATSAYAGDDSSGVLTVSQGTSLVAKLSFAGNYGNAKFLLSPDPSGIGTDITEAPCFVEGTRILTTQGEIPVEALQPEDLVATQSGELMPVAWLGCARVDCRRHPNPKLVWPVRISAGAITDGIPGQDLWLSPDHAIFLEGVLIPVKHLINRATITQMHTDCVTYWHVELPVHAVIFAESLPSESYLDTGNRMQFMNGGAYLLLHPDFSARHWDNACAPLCTDGPVLNAVRSRLHQRIIDASPIRVRACQRIITPAVARGRTLRFLLPPGTQEVEILSGYSPFNDGILHSQAYGVCISGIVVNGRVVALDDAALGRGFQPIEHHTGKSWRWIGTSAQLLLPTVNRHSGPMILDLLVSQVLRDEPPRTEFMEPSQAA